MFIIQVVRNAHGINKVWAAPQVQESTEIMINVQYPGGCPWPNQYTYYNQPLLVLWDSIKLHLIRFHTHHIQNYQATIWENVLNPEIAG